MGAWGHEIFQDDTNCDIADQIVNLENPFQMFTDFIDKLNDVKYLEHYLEYEDCSAILILAAIVDGILNGTCYPDEPESFRAFIDAKKNIPVGNLKKGTVNALDRLLGENSELNELWSENEELYPLWKDIIIQMKERLT